MPKVVVKFCLRLEHIMFGSLNEGANTSFHSHTTLNGPNLV